MVLSLYAVVSLLTLPCLVLLGVWLFHLPSATGICDTIGTLGTGGSGQFSLKTLGDCRECEFFTPDGLKLQGTYVRRRTVERLGVVVFCHEFGGDRHVAAPYVAGLLDEGFDVFAFDFRNHGESERMAGYTPRTWATRYEVLDVMAALNYVRSLEDADPEGVALVGISRGGSAAMSTASCAEGVWALITDGAFVSRWVTTANIRRFMPQFVRLAPVLTRLPWFVHSIYGTVVHDLVARKVKHPCINLVNDVRGLRLPALMIHGARDSTIPVELAYRLWRRLPNRARLWIAPKSSHNRSLRTHPARYRRRICRFLKNHAPGPAHWPHEIAPTVSPNAACTVRVAEKRPPAYARTTAS
ncbi:MAG: alpha/beta fold hydrolase [Candidatus Anammoximicrobium sp.]|nr:alpha/beta fold hydrolase [Candidatus Anammoximicrobium sp.]